MHTRLIRSQVIFWVCLFTLLGFYREGSSEQVVGQLDLAAGEVRVDEGYFLFKRPIEFGPYSNYTGVEVQTIISLLGTDDKIPANAISLLLNFRSHFLVRDVSYIDINGHRLDLDIEGKTTEYIFMPISKTDQSITVTHNLVWFSICVVGYLAGDYFDVQ